MIKVAMIGAGSVVFSKKLTGDILAFPEFRNAAFSYMDVDRERLEVGTALCRKTAQALGASPIIHATQDRQEALSGADFVINMVQVGGFDSTLIDFEIPRKYGLNFTIADTTGPGGMFRALRTFPMLSEMCRDMQAVCPRAVLLNYSNPMGMNMQTITRTSDVRAVGLCHSVQGTLSQIMDYIGEKPQDVTYVCAGINHMAFYLRLEKDGHDLYPRLFDAMRKPDIFNTNKVRFELMNRLGYFVTESSEHSAEYSPYFIPHGQAHSAKFNVPLDEYLRRCDCIVEEFERLKALSRTDTPLEVRQSPEYGSTIIYSMCTGKPAVVYGNMPNRGTITNLASGVIVEAPTVVDRAGLRFISAGELPPQLVGYMQPHITQQELFIRAALEGRRDAIYQAAMFDPLTAATLTLDQIVEMCDELIAAHGCVSEGGVLPELDRKKTLVATSGKAFAAVDAGQLRKNWCAARTRGYEEYIKEWIIIGPFAAEKDNRRGLDLATDVETDYLKSADDGVNGIKAYRSGESTLHWKIVAANAQGFLDLEAAVGRVEWAVAYAYAEISSVHGRDAILRVGSDDGIAVWLNKQLVHKHEVGRGYRPDCDRVPVYLKAGTNRIFVKIDNYTSGWGFGLAVPKANF